ncbi:MAG: TolC family protein [Bacteroidales bacterium]
MKNILLIATSTIIMASCSTYSSFKSPEVEVSDICGQDVEMQQDTILAAPSWREVFVDKNLSALIDSALKSNSDLQIALLNIEQSQAQLLSSKLAYLPSLAIGAEGALYKPKDVDLMKTYSVPLTMQWEIDLFGKLRNSKEQARSSLLRSKEYSRMVQSQLISSIANSYYTLIMLDEQLAITTESVRNQKENLEAMKAMKDAGMQTQMAVNQAEASYFGVMSTQRDLETQIRVVENSLSLLVNRAPSTIERGTFMDHGSVEIAPSNTVPLSMLSSRPDVKEAEYALRSNFYAVNVARAAFYPSINISGGASWTNNNFGMMVNPATLLMSAMGSLAQPIFNKGLNKANLKVAKIQYEQAKLAFEKSLLTAGGEVNNALLSCSNSQAKLEYRYQQVEANRLAYSNSCEMMKYSSTTYLDVLVSQSMLLQSQLLQVADWFEGVQARVNLYKALGGGVE